VTQAGSAGGAYIALLAMCAIMAVQAKDGIILQEIEPRQERGQGQGSFRNRADGTPHHAFSQDDTPMGQMTSAAPKRNLQVRPSRLREGTGSP